MKTIEQIERESLRNGIRLTADEKTLQVAAEAHTLGCHKNAPVSFAPLCRDCFVLVHSVGFQPD